MYIAISNKLSLYSQLKPNNIINNALSVYPTFLSIHHQPSGSFHGPQLTELFSFLALSTITKAACAAVVLFTATSSAAAIDIPSTAVSVPGEIIEPVDGGVLRYLPDAVDDDAEAVNTLEARQGGNTSKYSCYGSGAWMRHDDLSPLSDWVCHTHFNYETTAQQSRTVSQNQRGQDLVTFRSGGGAANVIYEMRIHRPSDFHPARCMVAFRGLYARCSNGES